jgi:ribonuclease HI
MENIAFNIPAIIHRTKVVTTELYFNLPRKETNSNSETILVNWEPPPPDFFKLNTDGSVEGSPGQAGAGGVIRDHTGSWFKGFSRKIGITNSLAAELWGLRDGLVLAHQHNIKKLIIELDAKAVLDLIQPENLTSCSHHLYGALISDCRSLIQKLEVNRIQHTFREGNAMADILAKAGTKLSCPFVTFDYPPTFVIDQVVADSWGVKYPRIL